MEPVLDSIGDIHVANDLNREWKTSSQWKKTRICVEAKNWLHLSLSEWQTCMAKCLYKENKSTNPLCKENVFHTEVQGLNEYRLLDQPALDGTNVLGKYWHREM